jgi:hypothetical protein
VREYWLSVENTTITPDGVEVQTLTFDGSLPGPTLVADWVRALDKICLWA